MCLELYFSDTACMWIRGVMLAVVFGLFGGMLLHAWITGRKI